MSTQQLELTFEQPANRFRNPAFENRRHVTLLFKKDCSFPLFPMKKGNTWVLMGSASAYVEAKQKGLSSFPFAGGQCLFNDVEIIYDGHSRFDAHTAAGDYKGFSEFDLKVEKLMCKY